MVKYREILRLHAMGVSMRNISFSCKCSKTTVKNVVDRAKATVLVWPLPEEMGDAAIRAVLYPPNSLFTSVTRGARVRSVAVAALLDTHMRGTPPNSSNAWIWPSCHDFCLMSQKPSAQNLLRTTRLTDNCSTLHR